jgi:polar amino acid transport system permease protein
MDMSTLTSGGSPPDASQSEPIVAVPARHPGRWIAAAIVIVLAAQLIDSVVTNPRFEWGTVRQYLFASSVLHGVRVTIELTILSMTIGVALGVVLAVMRLSPNPIVSSAAWLYIWFFRATPLLVQLFFWGFVAALYPEISYALPFGPQIFGQPANTLIPIFVAALLGLSLNEGAYMAEIVRGGILSVDDGQSEAAQSIGMTQLQTMRRVVLPQAMRVIIPPTGNEVISMLKNTSLVSVLGYTELLYSVQIIYARNYQTIPLLIVACIWYMVLTSILYLFQGYIERRFSRGQTRDSPRGMLRFGQGR